MSDSTTETNSVPVADAASATANAENKTSERRGSQRNDPLASKCVAYISFGLGEAIEAIVCDFSSTGIGLLIDDAALIQSNKAVSVSYLDVYSTGAIVNHLRYSPNCIRIGIRWDQSNESVKSRFPVISKHLIFVRRQPAGTLVLEQFRPEGEFQVTLSEHELHEVVSFLAKPNGETTTKSAKRVLGSGVSLSRFADDSFTIQHGTQLLYGDGDIREFLETAKTNR